jgi:hypothetical protein
MTNNSFLAITLAQTVENNQCPVCTWNMKSGELEVLHFLVEFGATHWFARWTERCRCTAETNPSCPQRWLDFQFHQFLQKVIQIIHHNEPATWEQRALGMFPTASTFVHSKVSVFMEKKSPCTLLLSLPPNTNILRKNLIKSNWTHLLSIRVAEWRHRGVGAAPRSIRLALVKRTQSMELRPLEFLDIQLENIVQRLFWPFSASEDKHSIFRNWRCWNQGYDCVGQLYLPVWNILFDGVTPTVFASLHCVFQSNTTKYTHLQISGI